MGISLPRMLEQLRGVNPFGGDCVPARVPLFARGRPSMPIAHPWNFKRPIPILGSYYWGTDEETGAARHNRYLYVAGLPPLLVTRDPGVIKAILLATGDKPGQFDRDTAPAKGIARGTGEDTLLYANGETWRRQKKLVGKPFSRGTLFHPEEFSGFENTFRDTARVRIARLRAAQDRRGETKTRVALEPEIQVVMLEMLVNSFFGGEVSGDELRERHIPAITGLIEQMVIDVIFPRTHALWRLLTGRGRELRECKAAFEHLTDVALSGRAKGLGLWQQFKSDAPDDALRGNIRVFLAGALEATTSFAGWAITHLARRPDLQEQIFDEIKDMDSYDPDNLAQAKTLNAVLEETLRLTPALYFLPRRAREETQVETDDGRTMLIPAGTHICLDVWHANRCEEFWGAEATGYPAGEFAPERWDVLAERGVSPKDKLHFGFGFGPRVCPGKYLGMLEVGLVVGALVKVFQDHGDERARRGEGRRLDEARRRRDGGPRGARVVRAVGAGGVMRSVPGNVHSEYFARLELVRSAEVSTQEVLAWSEVVEQSGSLNAPGHLTSQSDELRRLMCAESGEMIDSAGWSVGERPDDPVWRDSPGTWDAFCAFRWTVVQAVFRERRRLLGRSVRRVSRRSPVRRFAFYESLSLSAGAERHESRLFASSALPTCDLWVAVREYGSPHDARELSEFVIECVCPPGRVDEVSRAILVACVEEVAWLDAD